MRLLQTQTILFMRLILPVLLSFGLFCASYAQQPDTLCTATVGELSAEVAALKAKTSAWDKVLAALKAAGLAVQEVKEKRGWECIICKK